MINPFKLLATYNDLNKIEVVAKEKISMNMKVTQISTLVISLLGAIGVPAFASTWLHAHLAIYTGFVVAALVLHAIFPSIFAAPSAADTQATGMSKIGCIALIALVLTGTLPAMGCSGSQVAQDIVNWTPALQGAVATVNTSAAVLDPAAAPIFMAATVGFDAASNLLVAEAKAYLANPNASVLAQLQNAVVTFQQNVNSAILSAAKIVNPTSQQQALSSINAVGTIVNSILALVEQISSKAQVTAMSAASTVKLAQVQPFLDKRMAAELVAAHYGIPQFVGSSVVDDGILQLQREGF